MDGFELRMSNGSLGDRRKVILAAKGAKVFQ
jgi:hypothetical protein